MKVFDVVLFAITAQLVWAQDEGGDAGDASGGDAPAPPAPTPVAADGWSEDKWKNYLDPTAAGYWAPNDSSPTYKLADGSGKKCIATNSVPIVANGKGEDGEQVSEQAPTFCQFENNGNNDRCCTVTHD